MSDIVMTCIKERTLTVNRSTVHVNERKSSTTTLQSSGALANFSMPERDVCALIDVVTDTVQLSKGRFCI
jgi:hypothetical protein